MRFAMKNCFAAAILVLTASAALGQSVSTREQETQALRQQKEQLEIEVQIAELTNKLEALKRPVPPAATGPAASSHDQDLENLRRQREQLEMELQITTLQNKLEYAKKHPQGESGAPMGITKYTPDVARVEVFLGANYIRGNRRADESGLVRKGGKAELILNFTNVLALVTELNVNRDAHLAAFKGNANSYSLLFGPRLTARQFGRLIPYAQFNFGVAYTRAELAPVAVPTPAETAAVADSRKFSKAGRALSAGIGFDVRIFHWLSVRPVALDYIKFRTNQLGNDRDQAGLRYSAGITLRMGRR